MGPKHHPLKTAQRRTVALVAQLGVGASAEQGGGAEAEMLKTFNCGVGFVAVAGVDGVDAAQAALGSEGHKVFEIGRVDGGEGVTYKGALL